MDGSSFGPFLTFCHHSLAQPVLLTYAFLLTHLHADILHYACQVLRSQSEWTKEMALIYCLLGP